MYPTLALSIPTASPRVPGYSRPLTARLATPVSARDLTNSPSPVFSPTMVVATADGAARSGAFAPTDMLGRAASRHADERELKFDRERSTAARPCGYHAPWRDTRNPC